MFENVDGRTDDGVTGILIAHLGAFGSGELKIEEFKAFSRLLSAFPVFFNTFSVLDLIFKDFSRKPSKFKYFSSLWEP